MSRRHLLDRSRGTSPRSPDGSARGVARRASSAGWQAIREKELAKAEQALAKAQTKLAEFDAIRAILDLYQRANPNLTVEEVIPLLLRDGRAEDADRVLAYCGRTVAT